MAAALQVEVEAPLPDPHPEAIPAVKKVIGEAIAARLRALFPTQERAARALGTTQQNLSPLYTGRYERYSVPWMLMTASRCGIDIEVGTRCD